MQRYSFKHNKAAHATAILIAVLLHLGLFFWLNAPTKPVMIRQAISVTMVAPTTVAKKKHVKAHKPKKNVITSRSKVAKRKVAQKKLVKKIEKKKEFKKHEESKVNEPDFKTSGQVSKTAKAQKSALVKPVFNAAYLKNAAPSYPSRARRAKMQGELLLEVLVSTQGKAKSVTIVTSSGYRLLDKAAKKAVKKWRFIPAKSGTTPVEASVLVPIEFKLNQ